MKSRIGCARILATTLLLCGATLSVVAQEKELSLTPEEKRLNMESLEYVWKTIYEKHYDPAFGGLDWPALLPQMRARMEKAVSKRQASGILQDLVSRLELSHFLIIPAEIFSGLSQEGSADHPWGTTGLDLRVLAGRVLVVSVEARSPADAAGVKSGWEVLRIGDRELAPALEKAAKEYEGRLEKRTILSQALKVLARGRPGATTAFEFLDGQGKKVRLDLQNVESTGKRVQFGNFPASYVWIRTQTLDSGIGCIRFNVFLDPGGIMPAFNEAVKSFMNSPGIVIDVRGNSGGLGDMVVGMAGWFVKEKERYLGTLYLRGAQLKLIVRPRPETYAGPLAILVDELSTSASEFLSGGLQDLGRARIFGTRTPGAALPSIFERLPNGDGFQYAFANYIQAGGRRIEGNGVIPDEEVEHTREALLQGRDLVLEAAIRWIRSAGEKIP